MEESTSEIQGWKQQNPYLNLNLISYATVVDSFKQQEFLIWQEIWQVNNIFTYYDKWHTCVL